MSTSKRPTIRVKCYRCSRVMWSPTGARVLPGDEYRAERAEAAGARAAMSETPTELSDRVMRVARRDGADWYGLTCPSPKCGRKYRVLQADLDARIQAALDQNRSRVEVCLTRADLVNEIPDAHRSENLFASLAHYADPKAYAKPRQYIVTAENSRTGHRTRKST